jgi:hypothetical protein
MTAAGAGHPFGLPDTPLVLLLKYLPRRDVQRGAVPTRPAPISLTQRQSRGRTIRHAPFSDDDGNRLAT